MHFNITFSRFFVILAIENEAKIQNFRGYFENVDFAKINKKHGKTYGFFMICQVSGLQTTTKN